MSHSHGGFPGLVHTHTHDGSTHSHVSPSANLAPGQRLHLRGTVLPEGDVRDLWVVDGRISESFVADAVTVATDVWIMPGLVDAHSHVGMQADGATDDATAELMGAYHSGLAGGLPSDEALAAAGSGSAFIVLGSDWRASSAEDRS